MMPKSKTRPIMEPSRYGLVSSIIDKESYERSIQRFREARIILPTFAQLADPSTIPLEIQQAVTAVDLSVAHPLNLFRVHWYNAWGEVQSAEAPESVSYTHLKLPTKA